MAVQLKSATTEKECDSVANFFLDNLLAICKLEKINKDKVSILKEMKFFDYHKLYTFTKSDYQIEYLEENGSILVACIINKETGEMPFFAYIVKKNAHVLGRLMLEVLAQKYASSVKTGFFKIKALEMYKQNYLNAGFKITGSPVTKAGITIIPMEFGIFENNNER